MHTAASASAAAAAIKRLFFATWSLKRLRRSGKDVRRRASKRQAVSQSVSQSRIFCQSISIRLDRLSYTPLVKKTQFYVWKPLFYIPGIFSIIWLSGRGDILVSPGIVRQGCLSSRFDLTAPVKGSKRRLLTSLHTSTPLRVHQLVIGYARPLATFRG